MSFLLNPYAHGAADTLVFHAFDDVAGTFSADVIVGTGTVTEGRTSTIYAPDDSNVYQSFGSGVPAKRYAGGKWWVQAQPALTNSITYSRDLTNAAWSETGTSVAAYDAVGLTGAANTASTLTDDNASGFEYVQELVAIANDSNTHTWRLFVKKDAEASDRVLVYTVLSGGTAQYVWSYINTSTGTITEDSSVGTTALDIRDAGDWWECLFSVANNSTGNSTARIDIYPRAYNGTSSDATLTGSIIVGNVELHKNTTIAAVRGSGPIFTTSSAVTTNATDLSFDDANHDDTQGAWYCEVATVGYGTWCLAGLGNSGQFIRNNTSNAWSSGDGSSGVNGPVVGLAADGTQYKVAVAYGGSSRRVNTDNSWGSAGSYDGVFNNALSKIAVCKSSNPAVATPAPILIRNIRRYDQSYTDAQTTIDGLMA